MRHRTGKANASEEVKTVEVAEVLPPFDTVELLDSELKRILRDCKFHEVFKTHVEQELPFIRIEKQLKSPRGLEYGFYIYPDAPEKPMTSMQVRKIMDATRFLYDEEVRRNNGFTHFYLIQNEKPPKETLNSLKEKLSFVKASRI